MWDFIKKWIKMHVSWDIYEAINLPDWNWFIGIEYITNMLNLMLKDIFWDFSYLKKNVNALRN